MKKTLLCLAAAVMVMTSANAQVDSNLFNHLAIGVNVGTTGIGADLAVPCTKFVDIQAGFSIMPKITYSTNIHTTLPSFKDAAGVTHDLGAMNIPIQGKLNMVNGKVLINVYPFPVTSLHVTAGAYFGQGSIIEVYNTGTEIYEINNDIKEANETLGLSQEETSVKIGDYKLDPDPKGNVKATLKTNGFKPYVGLGIGRAVPKKRLNFKCDLGVVFWGTPEVVDHNNVSLSKQDWDGKDGGAFRIISKFKVYPVLNFRLAGRIF